MSEDFIIQMRPWFGQEEKDAIASYMEEDGFLTEFKKTEINANSTYLGSTTLSRWNF